MVLFKKADFRAYFSRGRYCGFTYSLASEKAFYLLFIAVAPSMHSMGFGSLILEEIAKQAGERPIYLAIEPMNENAENYPQRVKRLAFYEKNGFHLTELYYYEDQEAYQVMTNQPNHDQTDFKNLAMEVAGSGMNIQVLEVKNEKKSQN
ncbi:GNAT family N-acetyltransferase [Streptococcus cameli]